MNNKKIKIYPSIGDAFTVDLPDNICNADDVESAIATWLEDAFNFVEGWEFVSAKQENKCNTQENIFQHTGIIRRIDDLGRIVIPREIRHNLLLQENDPIEYMIYGQCIVMRKYHPGDKIAAHLEMLKYAVTEENLERKDQILRLIDNISEIL